MRVTIVTMLTVRTCQVPAALTLMKGLGVLCMPNASCSSELSAW